jgi:glucose/arabinose dehydrogenase
MRNDLYENASFKANRVNTIRIAFVLSFVTYLLVTNLSCKKDNDNGNGNGNGNGTPNLQLIADNMVSPVMVAEAPDNSKRLFIVDQPGQIWIVDKNGTKLNTPFIDLSSKIVTLTPQYDERGLLGLAFHPDFKNNGKFYVFYTALPHAGGPTPDTTWSSLTRISEFTVSSSNANVANMSSERVILEADHPQFNHNGGTIAFGPDGYLYAAIGDGGNKNDIGPGHVTDWYTVNAGGNAQNIYANILGKMIRIDVNSGSPYSIPPDNPFAGTTAKPEIYAFGFRNPYRFSFDMGGTHQIFLGDAGQSLYEEIDVVTKGGNYGWNVKEGTVCFNADSEKLIRNTCPSVDTYGHALIDPVIQVKNYSNPDGDGIALTIIGGYVYRGSLLPSLTGKYIFGIFSKDGKPNAKIFSSTVGSSTGLSPYDMIGLKDYPDNLGMYLKGFGQDLSGEIYLATSGQLGVSGSTGKVYKLVSVK